MPVAPMPALQIAIVAALTRVRGTAGIVRMMPVPERLSVGPETEPRAAFPAYRWELIKMPHFGHALGVETSPKAGFRTNVPLCR